MRLFCFPFSGGSASIYSGWFRSLSPSIKLCPVELAGRHKRYSEPFFKSIEEAVCDLLKKIRIDLKSPYALFGHSLGCTLIYELVHLIMKEGLPLPEHIFLSGSEPPHYSKNKTNLRDLPDDAFLRELIKFGGISEEFVKSQQLQKLFLPILRADFHMYELYEPNSEKFIFPCNITILAGIQDILVDFENVQYWNTYTNRKCDIKSFNGHHFFIKDHSYEVTNIIETALQNAIYTQSS